MKDKIDNERYKEACNKLLDKFKQDPLYDLKQEFGMMLMRHINDLTPAERLRYDELKAILCNQQAK